MSKSNWPKSKCLQCCILSLSFRGQAAFLLFLLYSGASIHWLMAPSLISKTNNIASFSLTTPEHSSLYLFPLTLTIRSFVVIVGSPTARKFYHFKILYLSTSKSFFIMSGSIITDWRLGHGHL